MEHPQRGGGVPRITEEMFHNRFPLSPLREAAVYEGKGGNRYGEVVPNPRPAVESVYVE